MERNEESYEKLKQLYSRRIEYDSFSKGYEIEKLVNSLIGEIVSPYKQDFEAKTGKYVFDGWVKIGGGRSIYYEIHSGNLSAFRYERLLDFVRSTYFPRKTYLLIIARSFSDKDEERIEKLVNSIRTNKIKLGFMGFEELISLHRFSSNLQTRTPDKELKTLKKLFLEQLFEYRPIINKRLFDEALTSARQHFNIREIKVAGEPILRDVWKRMRAFGGFELLDAHTRAVYRYSGKMNNLLVKPKYSFSDVSSADIPKEAGVYAIYDKRLAATIYIGRTRNLRRRLLRNHKSGNIRGSQFRKALGQNFALKPEAEITNYILKNCSFQFVVVEKFEEMVRLEHFATAVLAPVLNVRLKQ